MVLVPVPVVTVDGTTVNYRTARFGRQGKFLSMGRIEQSRVFWFTYDNCKQLDLLLFCGMATDSNDVKDLLSDPIAQSSLLYTLPTDIDTVDCVLQNLVVS